MTSSLIMGVLKGGNPGQPIRYEPEKSRFEPLTVENWTRQFYASPVEFGGGLPSDQPRIAGASASLPQLH